jgi:hypothetical protein
MSAELRGNISPPSSGYKNEPSKKSFSWLLHSDLIFVLFGWDLNPLKSLFQVPYVQVP